MSSPKQQPTKAKSHRVSIFRRSVQQQQQQPAQPQVSRYQDHFSLQAPTSIVRFQNSNSAARVIYNRDSQLVLEENYDKVTKQRTVTIKQMPEKNGGSLRLLRFSYTLVAAFFTGFLLVFAILVILFVVFDFVIALGLDDGQTANYPFAVGTILSLPILVHGFSLIMMLAGFFVMDLWKGHYLFKKFVLPSIKDEIVEWIFLLGFIITPLFFMGGWLLAKSENWWEYGLLYWFGSVFLFYVAFLYSVLIYEVRVFTPIVRASGCIEESHSFLESAKICIKLRLRHSLSGYCYTNYASFGPPEMALPSDDHSDDGIATTESRNRLVAGTLRENVGGFYTKFTQLSCCECLYEKLDPPKRLFSIDDLVERRPYSTSYSWDLEKLFCTSHKTRNITIIKGPGAITAAQVQNTIWCASLGVFLIYFLLLSALVYMDFGWLYVVLILLVVIVLSLPCFIRLVKMFLEIKGLRMVKQEFKSHQEDDADPKNNYSGDNAVEMMGKTITPPNIEADLESENGPQEGVQVKVTNLKVQEGVEQVLSPETSDGVIKAGKATTIEPSVSVTERSLEWTGFSKDENEFSVGVFYISEKYRVTQPTFCFNSVVFFFTAMCFVLWPTVSLFTGESWQLGIIYFVLAVVSVLRYFTNPKILVEESGKLHHTIAKHARKSPESPTTPSLFPNKLFPSLPGNLKQENDEETDRWQNLSRLSEVTATISRGKSYGIWIVFFWIFSVALIFVGVKAAMAEDTESTQDNTFTVTNEFYYERQASLHYTTCEFTRNIYDNFAVSMADYVFLAAMPYQTINAMETNIQNWFGPGVVIDSPNIVTDFRKSEIPRLPVFYRLFTSEKPKGTLAVVSIRGTHNQWDIFADGQLWGAAWAMQMVRGVLPIGHIFTPILDQMVIILSSVQSGTINRLSYYRSTTAFINHLKASGNYSSIVIVGHSLGGGLGIISGAQTETQVVAVSGPNALISRHVFGVTAESLERFTFNIIPDRDMVAAIDDPTKNVQRIECRAPHNELLGCHTVTRSLCEIIYTCGSDRRPILCECSKKFGYPEPLPKPNTTMTFKQVCGEGDM